MFFAVDGEIRYDRAASFMDICNDNGAQNLGIVLEGLNPTATQATPQS